MIFLKHVLMLAAIFAIVPLAARILINRINRRAGIANVPIDAPYLLQTVSLGLLLSLAAEGFFHFMWSYGMLENVARLISLGVVGGLYGWFFGIQEYVHTWASIALGVAGGLCTAALYMVLAPVMNPLLLSLMPAMLTVLPLLAIDFPNGPIGRTLRAGLGILPINGYLR